MRIAVIGAGAVGGYYGAMLSRAGHDVSLVARGAHLAALRESGLTVRATAGAFTVRPRAVADPADVGSVELILFAVKTYDNASSLPLLRPLLGPGTVVLTLQNGASSATDVGAVVGPDRVLAGPTYIAAALRGPRTRRRRRS